MVEGSIVEMGFQAWAGGFGLNIMKLLGEWEQKKNRMVSCEGESWSNILENQDDLTYFLYHVMCSI